GCPASEGIFSVCEMPFSPWQATHTSAFSLPAARSAAGAETTNNAVPHRATRSDRGRMVDTSGFSAIARGATEQSRNARLRSPVPERPQPLTSQVLLLLGVADAINRASPIIRHQNRSVLVQDDVGGPAEIATVPFDPARRELRLLGVLAIRIDVDPDD